MLFCQKSQFYEKTIWSCKIFYCMTKCCVFTNGSGDFLQLFGCRNKWLCNWNKYCCRYWTSFKWRFLLGAGAAVSRTDSTQTWSQLKLGQKYLIQSTAANLDHKVQTSDLNLAEMLKFDLLRAAGRWTPENLNELKKNETTRLHIDVRHISCVNTEKYFKFAAKGGSNSCWIMKYFVLTTKILFDQINSYK